MNKDQLIEALVKKAGCSKRAASHCLNVILDEISKALSKGEEVSLPGFGKFLVQERKEKEGINPKTKQKIKIPARKVPRFKPGKTLKDIVR
jgi:DNA-binding protein HU-beta